MHLVTHIAHLQIVDVLASEVEHLLDEDDAGDGAEAALKTLMTFVPANGIWAYSEAGMRRMVQEFEADVPCVEVRCMCMFSS